MFTERLEALSSRIRGVRAVSLVAADGIPVETAPPDPSIDIELLAAELMAQVQSIDRNHTELGVGPVRELSVSTASATIQVGAVGEGYFLLLVLDSGIGQGRARYELRRAILDFEEDLA